MKTEFQNIAILGAGESGVGAAELAVKHGINVFVSDSGKVKEIYRQKLNELNIDWESGRHDEERILAADLIIKSPGIPDKAELIQKAKSLNIPVISEIEFGYHYCKGKVIAITGSNGKTTTTNLIYHILKKAGKKAAMVGNVGQSFAGALAKADHDFYVLEVSSFQLDDILDFKPDIAIILNITPDHLDRYEYKLENYVNSKFQIIKNQGPEEYFIYNSDDELILEALGKRNIKSHQLPISLKKKETEGAWLDNEQIIINLNNNPIAMSIHELALQGKHNIYNSMAASISGRILELRKDLIRESLSDFQNIEHRLELVMKVHGISFINDSKATNVNSTWYALECVPAKIIWIVGGVDKGNDYAPLLEMVKEKVKAIVCLGKDNKKIHDAFSSIVPDITDAMSANEAVKKAYAFGKSGDTILLSPACASFDLFENYEDRGNQFKKAVKSL